MHLAGWPTSPKLKHGVDVLYFRCGVGIVTSAEEQHNTADHIIKHQNAETLHCGEAHLSADLACTTGRHPEEVQGRTEETS